MKNFLILFLLSSTFIYKTSEAQSWVQQTSGTQDTLYAVFFVDANNGYAGGNNGTVVKTTNGGAIWTAANTSSTNPVRGFFFINVDTGWAAIGDVNNDETSGEIWKTTDGASTWTKETPNSSEARLGISFATANVGWAVGANLNGAIDIDATIDGGATWTNQTNSNIFGWVYAVQAISATTAVGVGNSFFPSQSGLGIATANGGSTWNQTTVNTSEFLYGEDFPSATRGFAVGVDGDISLTTDGGTTWNSQTSGTTEQLNGVSFSDTTTGWACGNGGTILYTSNGSTWTSQTSSVSGNLNGIYAVNNTGVWAVGDSGTILFMSLVTGIKDINKQEVNSLLIYPNPSSEETSISVNGNIDHLIPMTLVIYNTLGQQVKKIENISSSKIDLSDEGLASGTYQAAVLSGGKNIGNGRFIIY